MHAPDHAADPRAADALNDRRRAVFEALVVGAAMAAVVAIAIAGLWGFTRHSLEENYRAQLTALAQSAAVQVNPVLHRKVRTGGREQRLEYLQAIEPLRRLRTGVPGIRHVHTFALDGDYARLVLDVDEGRDHAATPLAFERPGDPRQAAILAALGWQGARPTADATATPYRDSRGEFMTGYAPILDASGNVEGVVAIDYDAADYVAHFVQGRERMLQSLLPATLMVLFLTYGLFGLRLRSLTAARAAARNADEARLAAREDKLTGLANRTAFIEQLQQHVSDAGSGTGPPFALLFLDFDHFKFVNDTLGHDAGDELLRQIAVRLRKSVAALAQPGTGPCRHVVSRFGGDEFVILLDDMPNEAGAHAAADQLLRDLAPLYTLRGVDISSTASVGIVHSSVAADDAEGMLRNADVAMYEAKRSGRGCWVAFDDAMRKRITRVLKLERSLLGAIGTPQLRLAYQPVVELETGRVTTVEALLRWQHPTLGEVPPADFLAMAEETGLIVQLGEWVLEESCRQLVEWQRIDPERAPPAVSVNVSRGELALGPRFVDRVRTALAKSGLAAHCLQIEVPGNDLLGGQAGMTTLLEQLRALGARLVLDEFGAGPAPLSALKAWRFDSVKVARSFVQGLSSNRDVMALTHATLTLIENLGMSSVALGVEDSAQLAILQSFGCRYAQGRLLGSPVEADEVLELAGAISIGRLEIADTLLAPQSAA